MEKASASETSVKFHQTTQRRIQEDSHHHTRRRENLKSSLQHNPFSSFGCEVCGQTDRRTRSASFTFFSSLHVAKERIKIDVSGMADRKQGQQ
jgi:hypothetical protein